MSYITAYYPSNPNHEKGFVDLLREQGKAHGHNITDDHAHVVANQIGREFQVSLLCEEDKIDGARGMTTTTDADFAEGRFLFLEDLIVAESARGK